MEAMTPLQNECWQLMQRIQVKHRIAARMIGTSESTLRKWLANDATGNVAALEEKIKNFIQRENEKLAAVHLQIPFVEIKDARIISRVLRTCHLDGVMGMIAGESGLGKTTATQEYARKHKDVIYIEANRSYTTKVLFRYLHIILGGNGIGSVNTMLDDITDKLRNSGRFIIVDQAEFLSDATIHLLRTVHEHARIGLTICGTDELYIRLRKRRGEFAQVVTRITIPALLNRWKDEDIISVVHATFPKNKAIAQECVKYAHGNGMLLKNLLFNALKFAGNENKITAEYLEKASKFTIQ